MKKQLFLLIVFLLSTLSYAQITTSNIKGFVVDEANAPLPGANILAVHTPTGTRYGAATNFDGRFNILNMRVGGPYIITVSYVGYKEQKFEEVFLTLGKTLDLDVAMVPDAQALDAVVITGTSSGVFGNDRTGAETSVGRREITSLPTISRSAADFTRLEPSANGDSFGGRNDQFNNFSLDGAIFNNPFGLDAPTPGGQTNAQPISLDAIDQIQVSTAPYDVTQSGFTGASINAVTKSGTNAFKGTAYGFFRNQSLTGKKVNGDDVPNADLEQNQFGFSIGGPLVKNKLFFFANFEKDDLSELGSAGFVPNSGSGAVNESIVSESHLMAVQSALSTLDYNTGRYEGFTYAAESTKGIVKLDWNINDNNRLAVIYNWLNASKEKPAHPTALGIRGPNNNVLQFENSGYEINNNLKSFQVELNSTLSNEASNKLQFGYSHFDDFRNPLSTPAPSINIRRDNANYIIAGHEPFSINNELDQKVIQLTNNLSFFKGDHTFTVGFSFEKFRFDNSFNLTAYGFDLFGGFDIDPFLDTNGNFADGTGAAFQQAIVDQYSGSFAFAQDVFNNFNNFENGTPGKWALAETNVGQLAFYLQDEWNVNKSFKLTYGIRFDKPLFFDTSQKVVENIERKGGFTDGTYVPGIPYFNPNTGEDVFLDSTVMPNNDFLISPRIGFNWDIKDEGKTQIRGGSGLFTGRFPFVWIGNQVQGTDVFFYQVVDPDFKFPQVWRTNIGADHRFGNGIILSADISYTKDINAAHVQNWGLRNPTGTLNGPGDNRPYYLDADKGNNAYVFTNSDEGRIWNATLKAQKTFKNGLYTSLAYNYLNAQDVNSIEAEITGDAFDFNPNAGNANNDVLAFSRYGNTHRFIGVASKKWDYGNDKWSTTISTFFEYAQGGRFNYVYAGNANGDSSFQNNDLIYIPTSSELQQMQFSAVGPNGETAAEQAASFEAYIQQDDYLSENRGQYAERYGALAPWRGRWDLKLLQDYNFKIGEKKQTIQLSVDVLNFGNLLNSEWGVVDQVANNQILGINVDPGTLTPTYTFNTNSNESFQAIPDVRSRWQAQFGVRYIF